jgi:peptidoglycan L-alanyl-D-glutamate endopeptidase CwlK
MLIPTQRAARTFMKNIAQAGLSQGFTVRILSGTRTFAEQGDLFEKHQHGGPLAARPGRSNHNFGIAWDVGVFNERGAYIDDLIDKKAMTKLIIISHLKVRIIRIAPNSHDAKSGASVC